MITILYTDREGGYWQPFNTDLTEEQILKQCKAQKIGYESTFNRVRVIDPECHFIDASAIMFPNGRVWDAVIGRFDENAGYDKEYFEKTLAKF